MTSTPESLWMSICHLSIYLRTKGISNTRETLRNLIYVQNIVPWRTVERRRKVEIFADPEAVLAWIVDNQQRLLAEATARRAAGARARAARHGCTYNKMPAQWHSLDEIPEGIREKLEHKANILLRYWELHPFPTSLTERLAELGYHGPLPLLYLLRKTKVKDTDKYNHASSWK